MYHGPLLPGYYEAWIGPEQLRLTEAYVQALRRFYRHLFRRKEFERAIDHARRAVAADPQREEIHRDLMRLYVAAGQPSAAINQYQQLERVLAEEMSVRPAAATRQLLLEIETHTQTPPESAPQKGAAVPAPHAAPPAQITAPTPPVPASALPSGTVTFLMTDIVGSTAHWEREADSYKKAQAAHHNLLRHLFGPHGGKEVKDLGDGFLVVFARAGDALDCAVACQGALSQEPVTNAEERANMPPLQVRMALHTGSAEPEGGDYHSLTVNRASRLLGAAHGGQILCTEETACLLRRDLEAGVRLVDLGVYRLRDLPQPERLFQAVWPQMRLQSFPPPRAEAGYASHLPLPVTRFFGRGQELARACEMVLEPGTRLVTLMGPGGNGKTRLAIEAPRQLVEPFSGAVWFVLLAETADAQSITKAVAEAMRLPPAPSVEAMDQAVDVLSRQPALLVLDNFEQLVDAGAHVIQELLERVPTLTCLITSRQQLNLSGERTLALQPLPTPQGKDSPELLSVFESVQLFVDRAQAVRPDFQVTSGNAAAVAGLCDSLEGIPLAIELAAARAQVLTPAQMLAQLQNRFEFLVNRKRDAAARHRTLRAAVDWSFRLLAPELQRFFCRLSVFRGGWTAAAAEAICTGEDPHGELQFRGLALDHLAQLVECSLVLVEDQSDGMRFRMLETLREYADSEAQKPDLCLAKQKHCEYFLALAEEARPHLIGPNQKMWLDRLETELDNFRSALSWSLENSDSRRGDGEHEQPEVESRTANGPRPFPLLFCATLAHFWWTRGYAAEGRSWCKAALDATEAQGRNGARALALRGAGVLAQQLADYMWAKECFKESMAIWQELKDQNGIANSLTSLGKLSWVQGDASSAKINFEQSLAILRAIENKHGMADALYGLGIVAHVQDDLALAQVYQKESLAISRQIGNLSGIATSLTNLGNVACDLGDLDSAKACHDESLSIFTELGYRHGIASAYTNLGNVTWDLGNLDAARSYHEKSLEIFRETGHRNGVANSLSNLAELTRILGDTDAAWDYAREALKIRSEMGSRFGIACSFDACSDLLCVALPNSTTGQTQKVIVNVERKASRAVRLMAAAEGLLQEIGSHFAPNDRERRTTNLAAMRQVLGEESFSRAWDEGKDMTLEQAIQCALGETN